MLKNLPAAPSSKAGSYSDGPTVKDSAHCDTEVGIFVHNCLNPRRAAINFWARFISFKSASSNAWYSISGESAHRRFAAQLKGCRTQMLRGCSQHYFGNIRTACVAAHKWLSSDSESSLQRDVKHCVGEQLRTMCRRQRGWGRIRISFRQNISTRGIILEVQRRFDPITASSIKHKAVADSVRVSRSDMWVSIREHISTAGSLGTWCAYKM